MTAAATSCRAPSRARASKTINSVILSREGSAAVPVWERMTAWCENSFNEGGGFHQPPRAERLHLVILSEA